MMRIQILPVLFVSLAVCQFLPAQMQSPWRAHDPTRPRPPIVTPVGISQPVRPPSDAIVLFDGTDLSRWQASDGSDSKWVLQDGCMLPTADSGPIETKQGFGDIQLHLEWSAPTPPQGTGQGRGNSGVYLMKQYEVQVLDSYENETYADGQAASIYGQSPPLANACLPPGQWQAYDIVFRRPRFDDAGKLVSPAIVTVFQNGVLVQDHFRMWGPSNWLRFDAYHPHAERLPISLQDHGNPVRFRNIWLRELTSPPVYQSLGQAKPQVLLSQAAIGEARGRLFSTGSTRRVLV